VDAQAPGGLGVFVDVRSAAPLKRSGVAMGRSVSVSSSEEGGPGRSGSPLGGEGV
jgi:hypothetical protein